LDSIVTFHFLNFALLSGRQPATIGSGSSVNQLGIADSVSQTLRSSLPAADMSRTTSVTCIASVEALIAYSKLSVTSAADVGPRPAPVARGARVVAESPGASDLGSASDVSAA